MKILLADDHEIIRFAIKSILRNAYPHAVFQEACNCAELKSLADTEQHDIIITDISMPGENVSEIIKMILKKSPKKPIVVLSMHSPQFYAARLFKMGVLAYVTKDTASVELSTAVEMALRRKKYITPNVAEFLASQFQGNLENPYLKLSQKEFEIFKMIAIGKSISEISALLSTNANIVSTYRYRILKKMGVNNNYDIMRHAISSGIAIG